MVSIVDVIVHSYEFFIFYSHITVIVFHSKKEMTDLIDNFDGDWKNVLNKQFIEFKNQFQELSNNEDLTDYELNKLDRSIKKVVKSLYEIIEWFEENLLNEKANEIIFDQTFEIFVYLLIRIFKKINFHLNDNDHGLTNAYLERLENTQTILHKRQKQFQRLLDKNILKNYDKQLLEFELNRQNCINELKNISFDQLKQTCSEIFDSYIRACVNFHSTLKVNGINCNTTEFIEYFFGEKIHLNEHEEKNLRSSITYFDIHLDKPHIICRKKLQYKQTLLDYFLPSQYNDELIKQNREIDMNSIDLIKSIRNYRWSVLLGGAGSGKTTFSRWLIRQYAQVLFTKEKTISIEDIHMGPIRIPILIRIGEFSEWLETHSTSNLLDYIGHQTWFGQKYTDDEFYILKDFVRYGHALIILDGLDEISTMDFHSRILILVKNFIQSYCKSHELISPFDNALIATEEFENDFRCEGLFGGNLILITSRILNYKIHPLKSELIVHYTIQPMNDKYLHNFIDDWCFYVQEEIIYLFNKYVNDFKEKKLKCQTKLKSKNLIQTIEKNEKLRSLISNPSVLSIVCTLFAQYGVETLGKTRVELYEKLVELMLQRWQYEQLNISEDILKLIFSNMAFYVHSRSGSGLIDEFDLNRLCYLTIEQCSKENMISKKYSRLEIEQLAKQFMQLVSEDAGIVAVRSLGVYAFLHLSFQEYFVCYALRKINRKTNENNFKEFIMNLFSMFPNPRLREPLNLVLGWISLNFTKENYDQFCNELLSTDYLYNKYVPLGSIWFASALNDLICLPSLSIVYHILNTLLNVYNSTNNETNIFAYKLKKAIDQLPAEVINNWFDITFSRKDLVIIWKLIPIIFGIVYTCKTLPSWITAKTCEIIWKLYGQFDIEVDNNIDRLLMIIATTSYDRLPIRSNSLQEYLLSKSLPKLRIHSSILAAIVALYGGLEINCSKTKKQTLVTFSARRMHRDSPLSSVFIEYLQDTISEQTLKLNRMINWCQQILSTTCSTYTTVQKVHSLVVLFCICGIHQSSNYEQYIGSDIWQLAIRHMKIVVIYLRQIFLVSPISKFKNNLTEIFEHFTNDIKENSLEFAQSASHSYCRLLRSQSSYLYPDTYFSSYNNFHFAIKMPKKIPLPNVTKWSNKRLIQLLSFICCCPISGTLLSTEEIESEDLKLLKKEIHPLQLLHDKPLVLLLSYISVSVQNLYKHLLEKNQISYPNDSSLSCLPFLHLLIEFLYVMINVTKSSIRFWILYTNLLPIIKQNQMENFLDLGIRLPPRAENNKYLAQAYNENCFKFYATEMREYNFNDYTDYRQLVDIKVQDRLTNAQTDLQLYAAACCLARVIKKDQLNQIWNATDAILQPLWKLDARITVCSLLFKRTQDINKDDQIKDYFFIVLNSLKEFEPKLPLLTVVALFNRCMTFIPKDFQVEKNILKNILQRLTTVTISEQQAICQALLSYSSLYTDIIQYVYKSRHLENMVKLQEIFLSTSAITFSNYCSMISFSNLDLTSTRSALLVCMQLYDLHSFVNFLSDSVVVQQQTRHSPIDDLSSMSTVEICLKALQKESINNLNITAASMISNFLRSQFKDIEKTNILQIQQALVDKTSLDESAVDFVLEWLNFRNHEELCTFAYHGALILSSSKIWIPTTMEICCELLCNENDYFCEAANQRIHSGDWHSMNEINYIIINYIDQWNKKNLKWITQIESCFFTLDIQTIDEIERILQLERNRFELSQKVTNYPYTISYFKLIENCSLEVQQYITTILQSLSINISNSTDLLFLSWILEHIPSQLLEGDEYVMTFFIEILCHSYPDKIKIIAAHKLCYFRENQQVEQLLWNIILNTEQQTSHELIAKCIWSLFIDRTDDSYMEEKRQTLNYLQENTSSAFIQQAVMTTMYRRIITEPEEYNVIDVYYVYINNAHLKNNQNVVSSSENNGYQRAAAWIIKHSSILLPKFIDDMYKNFDNQQNFSYVYYGTIAKEICVEFANEFRIVACQHPRSFDKNTFKKLLFEMSKRVNSSEQGNYLYVYGCFQQVTIDYIVMFFNTRYLYLAHKEYMEQLRHASDRDTIEFLTDTLRSSLSLKKRYIAAKLLMYLTISDELSIAELQSLLVESLDNIESLQIIDSSKSFIDYKFNLLSLLIHLLVKESESIHMKKIDNLLNENPHLSIPTALFF